MRFFFYSFNFSVLDISRHVDVYDAVMQIITALALCPCVFEPGGGDAITKLLSTSDSGASLLTMLKKLNDCICAYLSKIDIQLWFVSSYLVLHCTILSLLELKIF